MTNASVVVDSDPGVDDALALLYLLRAADVRVRAITTVYGNTDVESATLNVRRILDVADRGDLLIAKGAAGPLVGRPALASPVHGTDGLGGLWPTNPPAGQDAGLPAAEFLVDLARREPGRHHLIALGPLTNLALALRIDPLVLTRFSGVTVMAGSGRFATPGEARSGDANVANDPTAAREVLVAQRHELRLVGVDVTVRAIIDEAMSARLRDGPYVVGRFAGTVLARYEDFYRHQWGRRISPAHDGLAVALAVHPELIRTEVVGPVAVLDDGYGARIRLLQLPDGRPAPAFDTATATRATVVLDADIAGFVAGFERVLLT